MPEGDAGQAAEPARPRRRTGRWLRRITATLVVLVLAAAAAAYRFDLGTRLGLHRPDPVTEPAQVLPPAGLTLPTARAAAAVAATTPDQPVNGAAVRRAVARLVGERKLGPHVRVEVARLSDGRVVYRHGTGTVTPASTMKLLTAVAALESLGPGHRFRTSVVVTPQSPRIVLVGGGDPLLGRTPPEDDDYPVRTDLDTLAKRTAVGLRAIGRHRVRLGYDTTLFSGPSVNPRWEASYVPDDVVSPISPLWVDEGRDTAGLSHRSENSAVTAAEVFAKALRKRGIAVVGRPTTAVAPPESTGGRVIAEVRGAPLAQVVQHVLEVSDNEGAEVLARQVAVAQGEPASFTGAARAVRAVLGGLGIGTAGARILDGSGLSRDDRLAPGTLLEVIRAASSPRHPELRAAVTDVPVAGFTGSLASRFDTGDPDGRGRVRAKTGTLTGVHGLAGTVTTRDGAVLAFVAVADRVKPVNTSDARQDIDELAAALAGCTCAR